MTDSFNYSTTFVLDKAHLNECFVNSVVPMPPAVAYRNAILFVLVGLAIMLFTQLDAYLGYFIIGLGIVEALGRYFQQPWWVTRQLFGRSGNSKVTLTIDENGIHTHTHEGLTNSSILWADVNGVEQTHDGLLVLHRQGRNYISGKCLSDEARGFLVGKGG